MQNLKTFLQFTNNQNYDCPYQAFLKCMVNGEYGDVSDTQAHYDFC